MTEQPTGYDLYQDEQIARNTQLIKPDYAQPEGIEYSFPVVGQGISAQQYRQMSLAQGDGIIHRGQTPYYLEKHPTEAETNSKNTLILKVDSRTGVGEAVIGGYYHRLLQDMEISFPPVTSTTKYHVCITLDPTKENEPQGPVFLKRYAGPPPTSQNRQHIILNTVTREPNQLLSDAVITRYRQFVSPTIAVQNDDQLPYTEDVRYGSIAFSGHHGSGGIYKNVAQDDWRNVLIGPWEPLNIFTAFGWSGTARYRRRLGGIDVVVDIRNTDFPSDGGQAVQFPNDMAFKQPWFGAAYTAPDITGIRVEQGARSVRHQGSSRYLRFSVFIPDYFVS